MQQVCPIMSPYNISCSTAPYRVLQFVVLERGNQFWDFFMVSDQKKLKHLHINDIIMLVKALYNLFSQCKHPIDFYRNTSSLQDILGPTQAAFTDHLLIFVSPISLITEAAGNLCWDDGGPIPEVGRKTNYGSDGNSCSGHGSRWSQPEEGPAKGSATLNRCHSYPGNGL